MQHLPEQRQGTVLQADERVSLVRVRFVQPHGDFTEGRELSVDPRSAESLVERELAVYAGDAPAPEPEELDDPEEPEELDADDDPDTGDVTLPIPD